MRLFRPSAPRKEPIAIARLRAFPLFAHVSDADLRAVADAALLVTQPAGWTIVHAHTPADAGYLLVSGTCWVMKGKQPVAQLDPGDVFGASVLLRGELREATVCSLSRLELLRMDKDSFIALLERRPALQAALSVARQRERALYAGVPREVVDAMRTTPQAAPTTTPAIATA
ncbi:MAG TPA: cyclic nucleotide-binding domain-containing protein [Mycobacteriales bacterium]|nr:cyclic nucleotide-binding domain-containing protein [Mycobacteriales bacterium]